MNTTIGIGQSPGPDFEAWRDYVARNPDLRARRLMQRTCPHLSDAEAAAYDAPFPDARHKAGVRRFPQMVPTDPGMDGVEIGRRAVAFWSNAWQGESFMAVGMTDPVLGSPAMAWLHQQIRGCPAPLEVHEAGHFVQEWGAPIARAALDRFGLG